MYEHGESIYNIIPPKVVVPEKPPMYRSKHPGTLPPTASTFHTKGGAQPDVTNVAGSADQKPVADLPARGFGRLPSDLREDPNNYLKKYDKTTKVSSLAEVKKTSPEVLKPPHLKPSSRPRPAEGFGPPKKGEGPVMNLVTSKNFIVANAVEVILAAPRKVSDGAKDYLNKEDYGKVPKYLTHIKKDIEAEYEYIRQLQQQREDQERSQVRPMEEEERQFLIEGLKAKWEAVNTEYQGSTHLTKLDTMGKIKRKEKYEAELSQIEKDIERLAKKSILIDQTS